MIYGLNKHDYLENGPAVLAERARASNSTARTWLGLDHDHRLAIVERALRPANDVAIDDFPLAL